MTTMVEKVAQAIYDKATTFDGDQIAVHLGHSCIIDMSSRNSEELRENVMSVCRDAARAAIEAMMEPTDAMILSQGKSKPENAATETQRERAEALNRSVRRLAVETWREMIQAALKEGQ